MQQYKVIDQIRELKKEGKLIAYIQAGIIHVKLATWVDIYNLFESRIKGMDTKAEAVKYCARTFKMNKRTVYNIINGCEKEITF